jgi:hypothetical protein
LTLPQQYNHIWSTTITQATPDFHCIFLDRSLAFGFFRLPRIGRVFAQVHVRTLSGLKLRSENVDVARPSDGLTVHVGNVFNNVRGVRNDRLRHPVEVPMFIVRAFLEMAGWQCHGKSVKNALCICEITFAQTLDDLFETFPNLSPPSHAGLEELVSFSL